MTLSTERVLEVLCATFLGAALLRLAVGELHIDILGTSISVRNLSRPLIFAALFAAARIWIEREPPRMAAATIVVGRVLLGGVIAAGAFGWIVFLSTTCGGADSYGYVSAAERLLSGQLVQVEPLAHRLPFPNAIAAATPLGYIPSPRIADASVPIYPLGLPGLMALSIELVGRSGPFFVAPLMGALLLVAVHHAAVALSGDRIVALTATALTAVQPVVFTYAIQPMSDVPAAALFLTALAALVRHPPAPALAGTAAALCLLIRPALAPALALLVVIPMIANRRIDLGAAARYVVPFACGIALQLGLQWYLYGHPLSNGYADMGTLFSLERVGTNARSHGYWAWLSLGPVFLACAAIGVAVAPRMLQIAVAVVTITVTAPYLAYRTFDHWETLRFLLPALIVLTIPAAAGLQAVTRRIAGHIGGPVLAAVIVLALAHSWVTWLRMNNVFVMPDLETRYKVAGELVSQTTPPNAVLLAQLHSGSVRYYSGRTSASWDRIPSGSMPATIGALQDAGHPVYLLIDSNEERVSFEQHHGAIGHWLPVGQRRNVQLLEARRTTLSGRR